MVTATAGLSEGIITPETEIQDKGIFELITPSPRCWVYPAVHGAINVSEAIRDSCNYFFYSVGYDMSLDMGTYNAEKGIDILKKYASEYGLAERSGLEMNENEPSIATDYPVTAAIGQSNHNFTVSQLARYVMTVANRGKCYNLTLIDKVCDKDGKTLVDSEPNLGRELTDVSSSIWNAIRTGMHMDIDTLTAFKSVKETAAGKTGTAEEAANRGNHALFVCFAPYENPQDCLSGAYSPWLFFFKCRGYYCGSIRVLF